MQTKNSDLRAYRGYSYLSHNKSTKRKISVIFKEQVKKELTLQMWVYEFKPQSPYQNAVVWWQVCWGDGDWHIPCDSLAILASLTSFRPLRKLIKTKTNKHPKINSTEQQKNDIWACACLFMHTDVYRTRAHMCSPKHKHTYVCRLQDYRFLCWSLYHWNIKMTLQIIWKKRRKKIQVDSPLLSQK